MSKKKSIRIASGQGFWGDWLEAPVHQVQKGPIDYLMLDYLAEVTMSILSKQKTRDPKAGYARDFVDLVERILPECLEKNIKVLANAGGVNPHACADAIIERAKSLDLKRELKVAVVTGDDILDQLSQLQKEGETFDNFDTADSIKTIDGRIQSANVYLGCEALVEALRGGADIVITGRVADAALALAPMVYEFDWPLDDWDLLASGIVAGHIIECGAQASGGNCSADWQNIPDLANIGLPIIEMHEDGSFFVYKHPNTGGRIDLRSVKEQLVYEIGDPENYIVPDVVVDFTSLNLSDAGENRVKVDSVKGKQKPNKYKVSISYRDGYMAYGTLVFTWPDAYKKAVSAGEIIKERLAQAGVVLRRTHCEIIGVNSCHGSLTDFDNPEIPEVQFRMAVHDADRSAVQRFTREVAPLVLSGPPSVTGYAGGKRQVQEVAAYWPALVSRDKINVKVHYKTA